MLYHRASNSLYLTNDAATLWQYPVTLGQNGTVQNSQCSVNAAASSVVSSGTTMTLNLAMSFQAASAGNRNIYMEVYDGVADSGWQQRGIWAVPSSGPPTAVSVTPSTGTGVSQRPRLLFPTLSAIPQSSGGSGGTHHRYLGRGDAIYAEK